MGPETELLGRIYGLVKSAKHWQSAILKVTNNEKELHNDRASF